MIDGLTDVLSVVRRADRGAAAADRHPRSNDCRLVGGRARGGRRRNRQVAPRRRAEQARRGRWSHGSHRAMPRRGRGWAPYAPVHEVLAQLGDSSAGGTRPAEALPAALRRVAGERPVVLVVEDVHWADRSTRDLLTVLAGGPELPRVLLVATYRTDSLERGNPIAACSPSSIDRARAPPAPGAVGPGDVAEQLGASSAHSRRTGW